MSQLVAEITALFERLVGELPPDTATLNVYRVPKGDGTVVEVRPQNTGAASFGVHVDDEFHLVDFSFGALSTWELPMERRYRKGEKNILTEIEEMSRAVIVGNCEVSRSPFWLTGKIHVGDYTYKVTDFPMFPIPPFGTRRYTPYVKEFQVSDTLSGKDAVAQWFGEWPDFHDAEVVSLVLLRKGESLLRVYLDYRSKPAIVEFALEQVTDLELADFSCQNVISSLSLERRTDQTGESATRINLEPCYGLSGWIDAKRVRVQVVPGEPTR